MNKISLFVTLLYALLCPLGILAQEKVRQVISINEMFVLADQNSKSLRPDATGINEAREAVKVAQNARLPEIDASLSFSYLADGYLLDRDFSNGMKAPIPHFGNNFALEVSQVIYAGGAISTGIAIAKLQEANAQLNLDGSRNKIRFMLVGYYLDLFKQRNLLGVYEKNIEQTKQVLKDIRAKGDEGIVLKNDITRYELLLSNLELAKTQIKNTLAILNNNLTTTLGLPNNTVVEPDTTILSKVLPVENNEYWTTVAVDNSPALKQLSLAVQINEHQDKIIRSERLPQVALVAANYFDGPITIEVPPINKNLNYWFVGIGVNYKLSALYKTNKSINKSKLAIQRTAEQYDDVKEQTELAIKADYIRYLEAYEQLNTQQKSVELANQNYSVVSNRYKNDMALITDMLDASNAKLAAEVQLANAQINIVFDYFKLLYISGTLQKLRITN
ncbi:MAG: TolC family protein [Prevotellaceae bacterium]|jgi:outer membrane protein TolC|nr:TolC family protein [Prevotellaceae bacterium]